MGARYVRALERLSGLARFGMRQGLDEIAAVLAALGHPERRVPALHIAGTNGKGSTAAFAEAMLRAAGARTGLYTSPHLVRFTERVRLSGAEVDAEHLAAAVERVLAAPGGDALTFFEVATAAAFEVFAAAQVDVAIIECGLGGRLDATSTCLPFATVITRIARDHAEVLGDTLDAIAFEKAGIARAGVPLVVGPLPPGPLEVVAAQARAAGAPLFRAGHDFEARVVARRPDGTCIMDYRGPGGPLSGVVLGLAGAHQVENAALALAATAFAPPAIRADEVARRAGLYEVRWPGRLERVASDLRIDGAHNPDAAAALALALEGEPPLTLLVGMLADKDVDGVLSALVPLASRVVCTRPDSQRALPAAHLAERVRALRPSLAVEAVEDPEEALMRARRGGQVLACGSLYLAGAVRALQASEPRDPQPVSDPLAVRRP